MLGTRQEQRAVDKSDAARSHSETNMRNKALLTWNIRPQTKIEHFQKLREFASKLPLLGLELTDAWYTVYGNAPHILLGIVPQGSQSNHLQNTLASEEWEQMIAELRQYIASYHQRIVEDSGHFQF
jgi:hypothetical protein